VLNGMTDWFRDDLAALYALAEHGSVTPRIHGALPMTQVTRSHELVEQGAVIGKLVLVHG
jgi:D-arabinose 1-dehydrogenase-like Zn-dependent alcohol dehydrogenase